MAQLIHPSDNRREAVNRLADRASDVRILCAVDAITGGCPALNFIVRRSHEVRSMRMITAVVVAGLLAVSSQQGRAADAVVHDSTYGFSVALPAFPKQDDAGVAVTPITFTGPIHDGKVPSCNVQIQNMDATLDDFRTQSLGQFKALGVTLESEKRRKVSGKDALLLVSSGRDVKILSLAVEVRRSIYLVTCLASISQFPTYEKVFRDLLDSFAID